MNLTDAVVAIAATLLVLPLVDVIGELDGNHVGQLLRDNGDKLFAFVLSFVVIARFWMVHSGSIAIPPPTSRSSCGPTSPGCWASSSCPSRPS